MRFTSRIKTNDAGFDQNRQDMLALVDKLRELEGRGAAISEKRRPRFEQRGQITPRERLARLLDPGMPFLRLHTLSGYLMDTSKEERSLAGGTIMIGIGFVKGIRCLIVVDDSGIKAGAMAEGSLEAILSAQNLAMRQKLPFIHLVESAGANLPKYRVEYWANGGATFRKLAEMSAMGIATVALLHGPSTAGGAYMPGLSDYVIGVKKNGMAALAGAALVFAATGEKSKDEDIGGAEMHAKTSGLVEYLAEDDVHGIAITRDVIGKLDWNKSLPVKAERPFENPKYNPDELAGIVPVDTKVPYDVREVVARIVDGSDFEDFKPAYGASTVCLQARIYGHTVGIIGNNGPIDPQGATKVAQFIQLCEQSDTTLLFLQNTTGYMVGAEYEHAGMIKHGSKMIQAVTNTKSPRITLHIGASYGAGNYGMCGWAYKPDFLFAWPNSKSGVMGGEQAAKTMSVVARTGAKRKGEEVNEEVLAQQEALITHLFDSQSSAFYTSGQCIDHGVIDPRDTRKVLGFCLETIWEARHRKLNPNSFGVARM